MAEITPLPKPDVFVQQEFVTVSPLLNLPALPVVIIGENNQNVRPRGGAVQPDVQDNHGQNEQAGKAGVHPMLLAES